MEVLALTFLTVASQKVALLAAALPGSSPFKQAESVSGFIELC